MLEQRLSLSARVAGGLGSLHEGGHVEQQVHLPRAAENRDQAVKGTGLDVGVVQAIQRGPK